MKSRYALVFLTALLILAPVLSASAASADASVYAEMLEEAYPADGPGAAVLLVRDGEVLFRGARGMAELELGVALAPEQVFRLGSITKQFTATAIMMLAEEGKLSVDDEITKFLPDYPTHGHSITVEHLLHHTSGIFSYTNIPGYMLSGKLRADLTTEELVDVFDELEMEFTPGDRWNYNNSGYVLLGAIIEEVSGQSYADFVEERIFEPLGMDDSHYGGSQLIPRRVEGYAGGPGAYENAPFLSMTQPHAAGSLLSTVDDLWRWHQALHGGKLVSEETLERMTTRAKLNDGEEVDYGYGLQILTVRGRHTIAHGGGIFGFSTQMMWLPESKVFVAVLSNSPQNPISPTQLARQLAAHAVGDPFPPQVKIELSPEKLSDYPGVYQIDDETSRTVTLEDGQLFTQRTGGARLPIHAFADDAFFYDGSQTYLEFVRDASGTVTAMNMYPNGEPDAELATRVEGSTDGAAAADEREVADVSPELYDLWAGRYQIAPNFILELRREGDRLISQATGQGPVELFPSSIHRYFLRVVPAELEIVPGPDGRAEAVVLYQGGQEIRAARVE